MTLQERRYQPAPCLTCDFDRLRVLPWSARMRAYSDFDIAISSWALARQDRRLGGWQWRLDIRRAQRAWAHYKKAVRLAKQGRIAA